jgi:hypothetical protein
MAAAVHKLPFVERPDLTPYLIHLTKNWKRTAFLNLVSILKDGKIHGSETFPGRIAGVRQTATCFMDVPLFSLIGLTQPRTVECRAAW